jgi:hypothetical protein
MRLDQIKKISFSKYNVLMSCGYRFLLSYIKWMEKDPSNTGALYGLTVHETFEEWFTKGMPDGLEWLQQNYKTFYQEQQQKTKLTPDTKKNAELIDLIETSIPNLYLQLQKNGQLNKKTQVEVDVVHVEGGYVVSAKIDYLTIVNSNTAQITDAKGYKNKDHIDKDQIVLYGYMVHKTLGIKNFVGSGYMCFFPKINEFIPVDISIADGKLYFNEMIHNYHTKVKNEEYDPKPSFQNCMLCDVYSKCQYRHYVKFKEKSATPEQTILKLSNGKTSL